MVGVVFICSLFWYAILLLFSKKGGVQRVPTWAQAPPRLKQMRIFYLWEPYRVFHLGSRTGRQASEMSYELFELFVTELKFLDRN